MSNITLSAGIRQNLLSLQNTAANLTTTQEHLADRQEGQYRLRQSDQLFHVAVVEQPRQRSVSALLDQIGQAQQTLDAANNGLTGLTSLLEQALSTAQQAQQASTNDTARRDDRHGQPERQLAGGSQPSDRHRRHDLHGFDHCERRGLLHRSEDQRHVRPRQHRRGDGQRRRQRPSDPDRQHPQHQLHRLRYGPIGVRSRQHRGRREQQPRARRCKATTIRC